MDLIGQRLGNYRLVRLLGEGGYAQVYLGEHQLISMQAAIKVVHNRFSERDVTRFLHEARAISQLKHPHIVRILEFEVAQGLPYLVMEYAPGGSLRQRHADGIPLALPLIERYIQQTTAALAFAHAQRFIHRDVKPENLLIAAQGQILLADFGFALLTQSSSRLLSAQDVVGTAAYMAPEQLLGKPRRASDQYALGVMVYEWLTGTPPFTGTVPELVAKHLYVSPPSLRERVPTIGKTVEAVVLRALAKDPKARFPSVQAFATAFADACQDDLEAPIDVSPVLTASSPAGPEGRPLLDQADAPGRGGAQPALIGPQAPLRRWPVLAPRVPAAVKLPATVPSPASNRVRLQLSGDDHRAGFRWPLVRLLPLHLGLVLLVLMLVAGGGLYWQLTSFHQAVVTGQYVTRIEVGTGVDPGTQTMIQGKSDTFPVGTTVVLLCQVTGWSGYVLTRLYRGDILNTTQRLEVSDATDMVHSRPDLVGYFSASVRLVTSGRYRWEVDLLSSQSERQNVPGASITFQLTP